MDYLRQTLESPNPLSRFAHKRRHGVALDIALNRLPQGGRLLDYGCGPGMFLRMLKDRRPDVKLFGHDHRPTAESNAQFTFIADIRAVADHSIDMVTSLEVLEHMFDDEREALWGRVKRMLAPGGHFLVSVPIIGGPTLLLKEANKTFFYKKTQYHKYTFKELMLASGVRLREVAARVVVDSPIGGLLGVLLDVVDQQRLREVAAVQAIGSAQPQDFRGKNQFPATKTA